MYKKFLLFILIFIAGLTNQAILSAQTISLYAGSPAGTGGWSDGVGLTTHLLSQPQGLCFDRVGNMYVCDYANNRIRKISGTTISTIAGTGVAGWSGDGGPATNAKLNGPMAITVDDNFNVYFTDATSNRVREIIASSGNIITLAGNGTAGYSGDGAPATNYELSTPIGIAIGRDGNLYIGDQFNNRIRKLTPSGTISTWAGTGTGGFTGDGGVATATTLSYPTWLKFDMQGNLVFIDRESQRFRKINAGPRPADNIVSTVIGVGGVSGFVGDGGPATAAEFSYLPGGFSFDGAGNCYFADRSNYRVREVFISEVGGSNGVIFGSDTINTIAGTGTSASSGDGSGDGGAPATATFGLPIFVLLDTTGNYWISDPGRNVIRLVDIGNHRPHFVNGSFQTFNICENSVGDSINSLLDITDLDDRQKETWNILVPPLHGIAYAFDTVRSNGAAISMHGGYYTPNMNYSGNDTFIVWVNDGHSRDTTEIVVHITSFYAGAITTEPNIVCPGNTITLSDDTTGGAWTSSNTGIATVSSGVVTGVSAGNVFISYSITNTCGTTSSMAEVTVGTPIIKTIAGGGTSLGDGGPATAAQLNGPSGAILDASGNMYICDYSNNRIRKVSTSGTITTIAGTGTAGALGDGSAATSARLNHPTGICFDASGNLYIADFSNNKIRIVNTFGIIGTFAGTGSLGYTGDNGPATGATLNEPSCLVMDHSGNLLFTDGNNCVVRSIDPSGTIHTIAGTGTPGFSGDNGPATAAKLWFAFGIAVDTKNNIYIADQYSNRVREINTSGYIFTVAGSGVTGGGTGSYGGDNGPATNANIKNPSGVFVDHAGNIFISDYYNEIIRVVNTSGIITTIAGTPGTAGFTGDNGPPTAAELNHPNNIWLDGSDNIYIPDAANNRVREIIDTASYVPAITGPTSVCVGFTINLSDVLSGGTWTSTNTAVAPVGSSSGTVTGLSAGTTIISYAVLFPCGVLYATQVITVYPLPNPISGTPNVCVGQTTNLSDFPGGGTWSSSNPADGTVSSSGVVGGIAAGTTMITYTLGTGCYATQEVAVATTPGAITGTMSVCVGLTTLLSDGGLVGNWTTSNGAVATVGVSSGLVSGVSAGTASITFTLGSGCFASTIVTVNPNPSAITGSTSVCVGYSTSLSSGPGGGLWSNSNNAVGTISNSGSLTGISAGTESITYTLGTGCLVSTLVTVNTTPALITGALTICNGSSTFLSSTPPTGGWTSTNTVVATIGTSSGFVSGLSVGTTIISYTLPTGCFRTTTETITTTPGAIGGTTTVCVGSTTALSDLPGGGTWSNSNNAVGTINSGGFLTGVSSGTESITYSLGSGCIASTLVTVNPVPAPIIGSNNVCQGLTTVLTDLTAGGAWSSSSGVASVTGGTVTGVVAGTAIISYTLGTGCNSTLSFTVNSLPAPITGVFSICVGSSTSLNDASGLGNWSSSNTLVAPIVGTTGFMMGASAGTATITYMLGTGCFTTQQVTVNPTPGPITGASSVCVGSSTILNDAAFGGNWSSSNGSVATIVSGTGNLTGVSAGTVTITYIMASGCKATTGFTVNAAPSAISGTPSVCIGATTNLSNTGSGGTWTSSNILVATVGTGTGAVTGVSAGTANITYSLGAGCFAFTTVTVNSNPSAITPPGSVTVCPGQTTILGDVTPLGNWSSSNNIVATVLGGTVTGVSSGTVTISYTLATGCYALKIVTVSIAPNAISPASPVVCVGGILNLSDGIGGGIWTSSNPAVATIGSMSGSVNGVGTGSAMITYAIGLCYATTMVTVTGLLSAGIITGPSVMCSTTPVSLFESASGGIWSSGNVSVATVGGTGSVTGVGAGTVIISYSVSNSCGTAVATHSITVSIPGAGSILGSATICAGTFTTYTDAIVGGTWSLANASASITGTGFLTAITPGSNIITYSVSNTCGISTTTKTITIGAFLTAGTITGPTSECQGSAINLFDLAPGGAWSASNGNATVNSLGVVTGVSGGTVVISYTVSSSCGSASATQTVTVIPLPDAGSISGPANICIGGPATYTDVAPGGIWSLRNTSATISGTGLVTPVSTGTNIISYTVSNTCGTAVTTETINIGALLTAGSISGGSSVCVGSNTTLTDLTGVGVWSAGNGNATVVGGVVTGVAAGTVIISYTVSSACGSVSAIQPITVNPLPVAGSISGPGSLCIGAPATYTDGSPGGIWSLNNATGTITGLGLLTPISTGTNIVSYTVSNGCGSAYATENINIGILPTAGIISGPGFVCTGTPITLTDGITGGVWSASNSNATISGSGVVNGFVSGLDTISYTVTNSCGTAVATQLVTVNISASPGTILGPSSICAGTFTIYSDTAFGGTWSVTNASASITGSGVLSALIPGSTDTVIYTVSNACGAATTSKVVNIGVLLSSGTISGASGICTGSSTTFTDGVGGGVWSSSNASVATVSSSGSVHGVSAGTAMISYTVTLSCGTSVATAPITVSPTLVTGTISGPSTVCVGSSIPLADAAPGGVWSATNGNAAVSISGLVTGLSMGLDTINYTVSNFCGAASTFRVVTINPLPGSGGITGPSSVCAGSSVSLSDMSPGGVWSSSTISAATIGSGSGVVNGIAGGTAVISYAISGSCGSSLATATITVNALPAPGSISGLTDLCAGSLTSLTDAAPGGAWSSSNGNATITIGGLVTGITPGIDTMSYTVSNMCGIASATHIMTISVFPVAGTITGPSNVCVGSFDTLSDASPGGIWSSTTTSVANVGSLTGIVTGVATGTDNIVYTITNACGSVNTLVSVTVNPIPVSGSITGPDSVCQGSSISLADLATGGVWGAYNANATVTTSGVVTGITPGIDTILYSVTNSCGSALVVQTMTILPVPGPATISGSSTVCVGAIVTLTDPSTGGTWSVSNANATVSGPGLIEGVAAGTDTVFYTVINMCGSNVDSKIMTINPAPAISGITGTAEECVGLATTLHDLTSGGVWSSTNTAVATVGAFTGIVTGVSSGTASIDYTVTDGLGCVSVATVRDTVSVVPVGAPITGTMNICQGSATTLADAISGGAWSSNSISVATVNAVNGVVSGVTAGTDKIYYTISNACGFVRDSAFVTVNTTPSAGTISAAYTNLCAGSTVHLTDAASGGVWGSSDPAVATVSTSGIVTGISTGSVMISYKVTNSGGCSSTASVTITVSGTMPSAHVTPSGSVTLCHGSVTMSVVSSGGITYQWMRNGSPISGANSASYSTNTAGSYSVEISNGSCSELLTGPTLNPPPAPVITYSAPDELLTGSYSSYQWYLNGIAIPGANSSTYYYSTGGLYTVVVSDANGCQGTSIPYAVSGVNGVNIVVNNNDVHIYPNPASSMLHIDAPVAVNASILGIDGKVLMELNNATNIDISTLAAGIYLVQVYDGNNILIKTAKFAKIE